MVLGLLHPASRAQQQLRGAVFHHTEEKQTLKMVLLLTAKTPMCAFTVTLGKHLGDEHSPFMFHRLLGYPWLS